jgi:hypothetical protein
MNVPFRVTPHYSAMQFDPRFLELPGIMKLATFQSIPARPTAEVELKFDEKMKATLCIVHESKNADALMVNTIARVQGGNLELCYIRSDQVRSGQDFWYDWNNQLDPAKPVIFSSEEEALCWMVLLASDVGCPGQARADFPQAKSAIFWPTLLREMKDLHAIASVMLTSLLMCLHFGMVSFIVNLDAVTLV